MHQMIFIPSIVTALTDTTIFHSIMLQRVILKPEYLIKGLTVIQALDKIMDAINVPPKRV